MAKRRKDRQVSMQQMTGFGKRIGGFELVSEKEIAEQNAVLYEYRHVPSGARLFYLETDDKNKLFSVTFRTIPTDSTGVFHILEHSVFCGSEKYPIKEPFLEMEKGSVHTYLNAMTFSDHTMFPVSSRNEKDFLNLTSVYLDAVFRPLIYQNPNIFYQEGWRYTFDQGECGINGVVYNEMKGEEASVDFRIHEELMRQLFPDTCYRFTSGGDTKEIPKLTYEEFLEAHRTYYCPSNAVFYLEGAMDLEKIFSMIEGYLDEPDADNLSSEAEKKIIKDSPPVIEQEEKRQRVLKAHQIPVFEKQDPVDPVVKEIFYPVIPDEETEERTYLAFGKILCDSAQRIETCAAVILSDYLTSSMESPLTKGVLSGQLGQDVSMNVDNDFIQTCVTIQIDHSEAESLEEVRKLLINLSEEVPKVPDFHERLEAIIKNYEFGSKEKEEPRALYHAMDVIQGYFYGKSPEENLLFRDLYQELRELLKTDYYEKLLVKLLDEKSYSVIIAKPSVTKAEEERQEEAERVRKISESWSIEEKENYIRISENLLKWQQTLDEPENKAKLPTLSLADLDIVPSRNEIIKMECQGVPVIVYPAEISDMAYLKAYFPVPEKYKDSLAELSLLCDLLLDMPTRKYDLMTLEHKINAVMGNLHFEFLTAENRGERDVCQVYFVAEASFLKSCTAEAMELLLEVLQNTLYEDTDLAENILTQLQDAFRTELIENGSDLGIWKILSGWSSRGNARDELEGLRCYDYLKELCENYEERCEGFLAFVREAVREIITRDGMVIGLTIPKQDQENCISLYGVEYLLDQIPAGEEKQMDLFLEGETKDTFVALPSGIDYAAAGIRIKNCTLKKVAAWRVACHLLANEYLWNMIRVQGGAYDTGINFNYFGDLTFYTYRDPDGKKSLEVLKGAADYLKEFVESEETLDRYIIGAAAKMDGLLSPQVIGEMVCKEYLCQITYDDLKGIYQEILALTKGDLLTVAEELEACVGKMSTCLVGSGNAEE